MTNPADAIARRRADMPSRYRGIYDRAMSGRSKRASISAFCLECMGWDRREVALCTAPACPLYPQRPYKTGLEAEEVEIEVDDDAEVSE